jgi:iron complex outermembrane recepter protein
MVRFKVSLLTSSAAVLVCAMCPRLLLAQETPPPAPAATNRPQIEEVIVSAEKRATGRSVQKVPIAVTAIDADMMESAHVQNIVDLGHMAPGVTLDPTGSQLGSAAFTIRGIGDRSSTAAIDSAVAVNQDGMVLTLQNGLALLGTFDTQSVEILRGPQGVLQGVNAAGGAVNFTTPLPRNTFHESASITVGNFDQIGAQATVEGPITDNFLGKIAIAVNRVSGYFQNNDLGTFVAAPGNPTGKIPQHSGDLLSGTQTVVVKPTFQIQLSDDAKLKVFAQFEKDVDGNTAFMLFNPNFAPGAPAKTATIFGYTAHQTDPFATNQTTAGFTHITEEHLIGELDWNIGSGVWTTIAALRNVNYDALFSNSGSPFNILLVSTTEQNRQASLESRYSANFTDKLSYVAGVYLFADNLPVKVVSANNLAELKKPLVVPSDPNSPLNMDNQLTQYNQNTSTAAGFANIDYKLLQDLTLSGGLRYQYEHKSLHIQPGVDAAGTVYCTVGTLSNCPNTYYDTGKTWYTLTPRGTVSYQATPDVMVYASYSRGWGAGNFNPGGSTLAAVLTPADPETVNAYEIGTKSQWFDRRFRANVALYDEKFKSIQRTAISAIDGLHVQTLVNAATATIRGAEVELTALPLEGVQLTATAGYILAGYDTFTAVPPANTYVPNYNPLKLAFQDVPKWTTDFGASYTFELPKLEGNFQVQADYSWRSTQQGDFFNTPQNVIKPYGLINASFNYTHGPWSWSLWGRNLQNKFYAETAALAAGWVTSSGLPRTYGLTVSATF